LKLLELCLLYCQLCLLRLLVAWPRYWPRILWRAALLGILLCCVYELVSPARFPFLIAIRLPLSCAALFALNRLVGPKPPPN
jgi:hypothetical protein